MTGARPWLVLAALCLILGLGWLAFRGEPSLQVPPEAPRPAPASRKPPSARTESASPPAAETSAPATPASPGAVAVLKGKDWKTLLQRLAPEGWVQAHPGELEKLTALAARHEGDEEWEAGIVAYLLQGLPKGKELDAWERAAEALPENMAVSDFLVRSALTALGKDPDGLKALLERQQARTPQDARLSWLLASLAFRQGRGEDAEALLIQAADLPPWRERSGLAERGRLKTSFALRGKPGEAMTLMNFAEVFANLSSIALPDLGQMRSLSRAAVEKAETRRGAGEDTRALSLLEADLKFGAACSDGSRHVVTHLSGMAVQKQAAQALRDHAVATGNGPLQDRAERILAQLAEMRVEMRRWAQQGHGLDADMKRVEEVVRRTGIRPPKMEDWMTGANGSKESLETMQLLVLPEDRRFLETFTESMMEGSEMERYRALLEKRPAP